MGSTTFKIEKFNGRNNFGLWQVKMLALLKQQGLYRIVFDKASVPGSVTEFERKEMEMKAHSALQLSISDEVLCSVIQEKTAEGLWLKLEGLYMTKSLTKRLYLLQRLYQFRMKEGTSVEDHIHELNTTIMELRNVDEIVKDEHQAVILLCSLTQAYEPFVKSMMYGRDSLALEDVKAGLHSEALREKASKDAGDRSEAMSARADKGSKKESLKSKKKESKCFLCKEPGHWKRDCPKAKSKGKGEGRL